MKIFNVSLSVRIHQIAEIPDLPPEPEPAERKPFNDDPLDKQESMMGRYLDRLQGLMDRSAGGFFGPQVYGEPAGAGMSENVRIAADNFDDLQAVLKKFADTINALQKAPDSLLAAIQQGTAFPPRGR